MSAVPMAGTGAGPRPDPTTFTRRATERSPDGDGRVAATDDRTASSDDTASTAADTTTDDTTDTTE
ncbi:hypothetical protein C461_09821 [Halorubrum aidingense JCM 13560]|uniref:Uncharacterized protein n=1 Tax=Halorubrum aidingense JCM 13560 TaxID=1230454 RepID=M0PB73_9EURY|nr:hypothetical protein [Halorubrum aidingense]EMA66799.1 hypothetical protein C461_09821 [Halorubrum aidingense JCM 13560]